MRAERQLLRLGDYLVRRACQRLPPDIRQERYSERAAALPAILHDPQIRPAPRRAVRMLGYAADTLRGTAMTPVRAGRRTDRATAVFNLVLAALLVAMAWVIWATVRAPGPGPNYLRLAWSVLLVATLISMLVRPGKPVTVLICMSAALAGVADSLWNAAQAPGDWVNHVVAAGLFVGFLGGAVRLASRWARTRRA